MKKIVFSILSVAFVLNSHAQNVLKIGDEDISLNEFKSIFYKNNQNLEISKDYLDEYMNLFVNFKLKVIEAKALGLDTLSSFINELDGYRKQLAKPYLKNNDFDADMLNESYERMKKDINASHILIALDENASALDEKSAYDKLLELRKLILSRKISFEEAAEYNSDDKSALSNKGNLGYFTAFMMVYDFETAAYKTAVGEISMPIRTKYGYHILKINDKRDAVGKVKVAHIMFKLLKGANQNQISKAEEKINEVVKLLNNGDEFSDVAERYSEDRSTAVKGGVLPAFGVGKMVPEFENAAFSLKNIGDISSPFRTEYGWHIIVLLEKYPIGVFSDIESEIRRKIERDSRGELSQKALFEQLHKMYKVRNVASQYNNFRKTAALQVAKGAFKTSTINKSTLLTIDGKLVQVNDFAKYILENQKQGSNIDDMYIDFVNNRLLLHEESLLEEKYPEYKALLNEYREGILLFDMTNSMVWKKAVEDTLGLKRFFEENQSNYKWGERVDASVYSCVDLATAKKVKQDIYKKRRGKITDSDILDEINKDAVLSLQIESKKFERGDNKFIDDIEWKKGISRDIVLKDGSYILVDIHEVLPSVSKVMDEARGMVISDYQNALEKEWLSVLKSKYSIKINTKVLYSLIR
tara:strand:- start:48050 stop:49972 length:1923 start_codon:yes stop_codon:yes gene_type:complete